MRINVYEDNGKFVKTIQHTGLPFSKAFIGVWEEDVYMEMYLDVCDAYLKAKQRMDAKKAEENQVKRTESNVVYLDTPVLPVGFNHWSKQWDYGILGYMATPSAESANPVSCVSEKKEKKMNAYLYNIVGKDSGPTETELQRRHLLDGIANADEDRREILEKQYGLRDDDRPRTFEDFIARILAGKYTGPKDQQKDLYDPADHIRWRDPEKKEDHAGFKKAIEALKAEQERAEDDVIILPLDQALAAKRNFSGESATLLS